MHTSRHKAEAAAGMTALGKKFFELVEFDDTENLIAEIRKHHFGLFLVELTGIFITLVMIVMSFVVSAGIDSLSSFDINLNDANPLVFAVGAILSLLTLAGTVIAATLYQSNVIFVTDQKIAQVVYASLFHRKISQLSIGDIQDVTVVQKGVFPRIFDYGTLVIETAGEQQNYTFTYVPKPYENAQKIVGAHEENLKKYGN